MVVHESEARGALLALRVELPGLRRDAIVTVVLWMIWMPTRARVILEASEVISPSA
jgi:hypothetical protein